MGWVWVGRGRVEILKEYDMCVHSLVVGIKERYKGLRGREKVV
jgi:hypothetical protein